jgi:hypothetical protein
VSHLKACQQLVLLLVAAPKLALLLLLALQSWLALGWWGWQLV